MPTDSGVWGRVTQINGLPLLCVLLVHVLFFVILRCGAGTALAVR